MLLIRKSTFCQKVTGHKGIEIPLHNQSEKAYMCFKTRQACTNNYFVLQTIMSDPLHCRQIFGYQSCTSIFLLELVFSFPAAATTPWLPNFFFNPLFWGQFTFFSLVESEEQGENVESIFHLIIIAYSGTKIHLRIIWCWQEDCNLFCLKLFKFNNIPKTCITIKICLL